MPPVARFFLSDDSLGKRLRSLRLGPTKSDALSTFAGWGEATTVWARCKISGQVWSPDNTAHICAMIRAADFYVLVVRCNGGCVRDALGRVDWVLSVDQACTQPPPTVWSRCWRLLINTRVITMPTRPGQKFLPTEDDFFRRNRFVRFAHPPSQSKTKHLAESSK